MFLINSEKPGRLADKYLLMLLYLDELKITLWLIWLVCSKLPNKNISLTYPPIKLPIFCGL